MNEVICAGNSAIQIVRDILGRVPLNNCRTNDSITMEEIFLFYQIAEMRDDIGKNQGKEYPYCHPRIVASSIMAQHNKVTGMCQEYASLTYLLLKKMLTGNFIIYYMFKPVHFYVQVVNNLTDEIILIDPWFHNLNACYISDADPALLKDYYSHPDAGYIKAGFGCRDNIITDISLREAVLYLTELLVNYKAKHRIQLQKQPVEHILPKALSVIPMSRRSATRYCHTDDQPPHPDRNCHFDSWVLSAFCNDIRSNGRGSNRKGRILYDISAYLAMNNITDAFLLADFLKLIIQVALLVRNHPRTVTARKTLKIIKDNSYTSISNFISKEVGKPIRTLEYEDLYNFAGLTAPERHTDLSIEEMLSTEEIISKTYFTVKCYLDFNRRMSYYAGEDYALHP